MKEYRSVFYLLVYLCVVESRTIGKFESREQGGFNSIIYDTMCTNFDKRDLVDDQAEADANNNRDMMQLYFQQSGNQIIVSIINADDPTQKSLQILPQIALGLALFIGPFLVGLVLSLFLWPFLCCCACCSCCCVNLQDNRKITQCQFYWPSIVLILSLLLIVGSGIFGFLRASDVQNSYQAVGCSLGISFNDILIGNYSKDGKYFTGIDNIVSGLKNLKQNINQVDLILQNMTFSNSSGILRSAYDQGTNLLQTLSQVPNGTIGGTMNNFSYYHFDGTGTPDSVPSYFPTYLGTAFGVNASGAMNISYYIINQINQGLKLISTNAQQFVNQIDTVNDTIDAIASKAELLSTQTYQTDNDISHVMDTVSPNMSILSLGVKIFFAICIGLGSISIISTIAMTFCNKYSFRYVIYLVCLVLGFLAIFCFILALVFSIVTPAVYFGCDYLNVTISSPENMDTNMGKFVDAQSLAYVKVCLSGQSGDFINQIQGLDLSSINGLNNAINQMKNYNNISQVQMTINTTLYQLSYFIDSYYYTDNYDFDSKYDMAIMDRIANPKNYIQCTNNSFQMDSWVPSLRQNLIPCYGTTTNATDTQCPDSTAIIFGRGNSTDPTGCFGCMDSTKILLRSSDPITDIQSRYGTEGMCGTWVGQMTNLWTYYYYVKNMTMYPVRQRMFNTISTYYTNDTGYYYRLAEVGYQITLATQNLEQIVSTVFDPKQGMIAGLNCLLLGQDITLIHQTSCTHLFNTFYFLRLTLGLCAFGILVSLCCATCSSMRAYKLSLISKPKYRNQIQQSQEFQQYSRTALIKHPR